MSGSARARLAGECVRCLEPVSSSVDVTFQELYVYPEDPARGSHRHGSRASVATPTDAEDDGTKWLEDDLIDLEPVVRDAVVLALPFKPVCREDCPGLAPSAGSGWRTTRVMGTPPPTRGGRPCRI